jgi:hypothetical protein
LVRNEQEGPGKKRKLGKGCVAASMITYESQKAALKNMPLHGPITRANAFRSQKSCLLHVKARSLDSRPISYGVDTGQEGTRSRLIMHPSASSRLSTVSVLSIRLPLSSLDQGHDTKREGRIQNTRTTSSVHLAILAHPPQHARRPFI